MGTILISVPDISDNELVFDESETRRILKFFWPHLAQSIDDMAIDNEARRLAQTMLLAARVPMRWGISRPLPERLSGPVPA